MNGLKIILSICLLVLGIILSIAVLVNGYGLTIDSWGWILGGACGSTILTIFGLTIGNLE